MFWDELVNHLQKGQHHAAEILVAKMTGGERPLQPNTSQLATLLRLMLGAEGREFQIISKVLHYLEMQKHESLKTSISPSTNWFSNWFWNPLKQDSVLFRAFERERERDDDAAIYLARYLSFYDFSNVEFERIPLDDVDLEAHLSKRKLNAVVFLGRLGMYGKKTAKIFRNKKAFYYFPLDARPKDLAHGQLDPKMYHRICRFDENCNDEPRICTSEDDDYRTDYGLIQRYTVDHPHGGHLIVFGIWGCSTLGTLAAASWATLKTEPTFSRPSDVILNDSTNVEVLIRVNARMAELPRMWKLTATKVERVIVGERQWSVEDKQWRIRRNLEMIWKVDSGDIHIDGNKHQHVEDGVLRDVIHALACQNVTPGDGVPADVITPQKFTQAKRLREYTQGIMDYKNGMFYINGQVKVA